MIANNQFKNFNNFNKYFIIYLSVLAFCGVVHLYTKHDIGNDSTISEWLINYQGGLTRRGFLGEICFHISRLFNIELRFTIFLFQSTFFIFLLILNFYFFKNIKHNILTLFAVFTPIFILYPVAEIEVLARKEIFLYIYFLGIIHLCETKNNYNKYLDKYVFFITPVVCLIYEQVLLFFPFVIACLVFHKKIKTFRSFFKTCLLFTPALLVVLYFFIFPLSMEDHEIMKESLMLNFNERCYMSCELLRIHDIHRMGFILSSDYGSVPFNTTLVWIFRYLLIFLVGFFPIFFLSTYSKIKVDNFFSNLKLNNVFLLILFLYLPVIILFTFGTDWGRWIGMMISFTTYFYFFLFKNNYIDIDFKTMSGKLIFFKSKKIFVVIIFIIFAFGWNQKTQRSGDIATNPLWKVPYNTSKKIFGWDSFRLFENSAFSIWHQKYVE